MPGVIHQPMRRRIARPMTVAVPVVLAALAQFWLSSDCRPRDPEALGEGFYRVARVVDGDTLLLDSGARVRLIGVDTPETVKPESTVEAFGPEAAAYTEHFVADAGGKLYLRFDRERRTASIASWRMSSTASGCSTRSWSSRAWPGPGPNSLTPRRSSADSARRKPTPKPRDEESGDRTKIRRWCKAAYPKTAETTLSAPKHRTTPHNPTASRRPTIVGWCDPARNGWNHPFRSQRAGQPHTTKPPAPPHRRRVVERATQPETAGTTLAAAKHRTTPHNQTASCRPTALRTLAASRWAGGCPRMATRTSAGMVHRSALPGSTKMARSGPPYHKPRLWPCGPDGARGPWHAKKT